jgi:hypothetical protein
MAVSGPERPDGALQSPIKGLDQMVSSATNSGTAGRNGQGVVAEKYRRTCGRGRVFPVGSEPGARYCPFPCPLVPFEISAGPF